ncbi:MAG: SDR family NAD(P)-dependent oxidoreductase [Pseudomonadales bacterium]|nr:SDR family NAD(P)-dependent oxidoreductase [Pseudomonadales bacterium]NRA17967.1 SDR family NAD(P)-dependent oxidoreductase [Oceanospirillaceae bacterium]
MKLLIISGGSKGLGLALCNQYQKNGFTIVEFSRTAPHPFSVSIDLSSSVDSATVIATALAPLSAVQWQEIVIINNAGTLNPIGPAAKKPRGAVVDNININFTSGLLFIIEALKQFQGHSGKKTLVNISSGAALGGYPGWSLYCAAKAGLENFIAAVALEQDLQAKPFTAINIGPGVIDTDMQASIRKAKVEDFPAVERFIDRKESGELRPPEKVAADIFAISEQSNIENGRRYDAAG